LTSAKSVTIPEALNSKRFKGVNVVVRRPAFEQAKP
jgi:hypothetical protein